MAGYEWHAFFSLIIIGIIAFIVNHTFGFFPFSYVDIAILLPIIILYGMLPDVDHRMSKIRNIVFVVFFSGFIVILGSIIFMVWKDYEKLPIYIAAGFGILQAILALVIMTVKHRGALHTVIAGGIFAIPVLYFFNYNWLYYIVAWLAYVAHLVLDGDLGK